MQQQATQSSIMPSFSPPSITTDQIQKYLDENKKLILAIMDNQNLGKLAECAQYQAQLQKNLMYLAAIADAQPQVATVPAQMAPHPAMQMQQGAYYMQQQAAAMVQHPGGFPPRMPSHPQFSSPQHPQPMMLGQMNFRPTGPSSIPLGSGSSTGQPTPSGVSESREPNKQEDPEAGANTGHNGEGEQPFLKGSEEAK